MVNASGVVAGVNGYKPAWVVRDGRYAVLPVPTGTSEIVVTGINARGDLVGSVEGTTIGTVAVVWPAAAPGTVRELATPDGWDSTAVAITDGGVIVGNLQRDDPPRYEPYRWTVDGAGSPLPDPPKDPSPSPAALPKQTTVVAANGDWVLGNNGVRWNLRTGQTDTYTGITGEMIDRQGRIFGYTGHYHPAVWVNGAVQTLPVPPATPLGEIRLISPDGTHAYSALQTDPDPTPHYTLWSCGR